MKKFQKTPYALAMSATLLPFAAHAAQTEANPFALSDLSSGYMQTAEAEKDGASKMQDGACGEGKCGGAMMQQKAPDAKAMEGKCAGNKPTPKTNGGQSGDSKKSGDGK